VYCTVKSQVMVVDPSVTMAVTGFDPRQFRLTGLETPTEERVVVGISGGTLSAFWRELLADAASGYPNVPRWQVSSPESFALAGRQAPCAGHRDV
jgi:hypothetical protein